MQADYYRPNVYQHPDQAGFVGPMGDRPLGDYGTKDARNYATTALFFGAIAAFASTPFLAGYGVYKRGYGLGMSALAGVGSLAAMFYMSDVVPAVSLMIPPAAAYYAYKD